jgi:hypothetical protein
MCETMFETKLTIAKTGLQTNKRERERETNTKIHKHRNAQTHKIEKMGKSRLLKSPTRDCSEIAAPFSLVEDAAICD